MDDLNITMEEYIRLEEEKAQKHGKVFNWETAKYGIIKNTISEPTVSSLNDEIDFKISFDDSDDEDYMVIFKKISFSYKSFSTNDLKMDSENENEKVNLHSPEPTVSCFDDLNFFNDFENEFPAIVYNDALTSKSYLLTELILNPQHIDEFDLNNKTSLSEYDEEEQNILYFNDLFFFNIIRPDDLKSEKDNDDNDIDIIQSSEVMALPSREQRNPFLRGLPDLMAEGLSARMLMEHRDAQGVSLFNSRAWRQLFDIRRPLAPEKMTVTDLFYLRGMDVDSVNFPYLLARYLRLFAAGRKSRAHIFGRQFVAHLAEHFGLLTMETLRGLTVIAPKLLIIDMAELVRLQICKQLDDTWAWVAMGPKRQPDATAGALGVAQDAPIIDEGGQADPAPIQAAPPPPPVAARTMPQRMARLEEDVHEIR
ncbi:hypothetical protein Tco_0703805 [Tanacetum coccineum]|uniref:Uncharacterized protein n=1 Tax=Tanacetum coccineum TaxID=301880 RepID=A0ABQ4Y000_9ASTR